ncbi:hypothetical protein BHM03_00016804 [Ensete ventricosum]|nr:hypothetical protein BHM03_00016804 [Ensete ventricosum]
MVLDPGGKSTIMPPHTRSTVLIDATFSRVAVPPRIAVGLTSLGEAFYAERARNACDFEWTPRQFPRTTAVTDVFYSTIHAPFPTDMDELAHAGEPSRADSLAMTPSSTNILALKEGPDVTRTSVEQSKPRAPQRTDTHSLIDPANQRAGLSPPGGRNQCVGTYAESLLEVV